MPTAAELATLYAKPHQHRQWLDHIVRVNVTTEVASLFVPPGGTVADLSCGDATIARRLAEESGGALILGDFAAGYPITGPIEETVEGLRWKQASMFVLSETLEHLDDPDAVLKQIRDKCDHLVVSTPDGETDPSRNPEHVHGWDSEEVRAMLVAADFEPLAYTLLDLRPAGFEYAFQMWVCR
jgi:2-polyprenyl-3-methyl-5-hydroxy-6-metoxy-1,4-benzoquinol methylase